MQACRKLTKYFAGTLPFGSPKARTDIPDAFIVEAILDLALRTRSLPLPMMVG